MAVEAFVRRVKATGRATGAAISGSGGAFLVAARPVPLRRDRAAVLVLARRLDGALLDLVAGGASEAVLVSDGLRPLGGGGPEAALLEPLVGREASAELPIAGNATRAVVAHRVAYTLYSAIDAAARRFGRDEQQSPINRDVALRAGADVRRLERGLARIRDVPHLPAAVVALEDVLAHECQIRVH